MQSMSMPALSMLLILLAEEGGDGRELWWSTETFPSRYKISPATRAKGTRELVGRRLLYVKKRLVSDTPNRVRDFGRERVRNVYQLINEATTVPTTTVTRRRKPSKPSATRRPKPRKKAEASLDASYVPLPEEWGRTS